VDANKEAMSSENVEEAPPAREADAGDVRTRPERPAAEGSGASEPRAGMPPSTRGKRVLVGRVVSDRMQKTVVVQIERRKLHPLYKKYITRSKKVKAHDENNECRVGDLVRVVESRPISKDKRWRLAEILEKAK
jgi:small subunit ribosomal protein S17